MTTESTIITEHAPTAKRQKPTSGHATRQRVKSYVELKNPVDPATGLSQCFRKVTTTMYVSLAPMYSLNPVYGIKSQHLDPLLMTWYAPVGGVVLAYNSLQLLGQDEGEYRARKKAAAAQNSGDDAKDNNDEILLPVGKIVHESPYAFLWIAVDLLIWKPQQGDVVQGVINLQAPSHLSLLVNDVFHASIRRDSIPEDWEFVYFEADETYYDANDETANAVDAAVDSIEKEQEQKNQAKDGAETGEESADSKEKASDANKLAGASKSLGYWVDGNGDKVYEVVNFSIKRVLVSGRLISVQGTLRDSNSTYSKTVSDGSNSSFSSSTASVSTDIKKPKKIVFGDDDMPKPTKKVFTDDDTEMNNLSERINKEIEATGAASLDPATEVLAAAPASGLPKDNGDDEDDDDAAAPKYAEDSDSDNDSD
ncbi:uncharacterized protein SAPINGB_P003994 [Magnusiomyces paraingens]|uniref:DNA-directed RNA polymerase subunit n=1 Tax=Magnusiomyces paraingens TaxID=2606893 RepID=A0A5E8BZM6_9ASCO|nr:uncharacterized protein SAPINGB_P003994 [Saprochaete ingens]VVT54275.1 unnamed protein product [Saprochaete ingens]